jgi:cysteine desulfurase family protein (TIGR01976 family)
MSANLDGWNEEDVRREFPALSLVDDGMPRIYADAPGGTQVASKALARLQSSLVDHCANEGGPFRTSRKTDEAMHDAHAVAAAFLGADADEVIFGLNTTSLLFHFSRMIARDWREGDDIVLTRMDHDANVAPWLIAAEERGVAVRWLDVDPNTYRYCYDQLPGLIGPRTRLVACNHASNFSGTINDVRRIVVAAKAVGALAMVDGVQSAAHLALDVRAIGCDLLATSPYKYFGPHAGLLYVRRELADRLRPLKVRPSPNDMPHKHAPGTPSFEAQCGSQGAIEHIAWLGERFGGAAGRSLRERIVAGFEAATAHETRLAQCFLRGLSELSAITLYGIGALSEVADRVPTFSLRIRGLEPEAVASAFAEQNIYVWCGSFYAYELAGRLGVRDDGGVVRIGFAHYNTLHEVERILDVLRALARGR